MSYLILGSNSFAGGSFVNYLLSEGHKVLGISRSPQTPAIFQPYFNHTNLNLYQFSQCDLNHDSKDIESIVRKHKPKYVVDFAGQGMVAESWINPEQWYLTNVASKVKLHECLRQCDFLERYIRVSTPEVYGSTVGCVTEDTRYHPSTPYAVSHAAIDMSLMTYFKQYQFPVILTRFANFYGPHQQLYRIVPSTIIYALTQQKLPLHGGGYAKRAFIHGHDVAVAIDQVIHKGKIGDIYHFSADVPLAIRDLVSKICSIMQVDFTSLVVSSDDRPGKDAHYEMNTSKARKELGWKPSYSLENGLNQTVSWIKNNLEIIKTLPLNYIHQP